MSRRHGRGVQVVRALMLRAQDTVGVKDLWKCLSRTESKLRGTVVAAAVAAAVPASSHTGQHSNVHEAGSTWPL
jgi:hypothetical protein